MSYQDILTKAQSLEYQSKRNDIELSFHHTNFEIVKLLCESNPQNTILYIKTLLVTKCKYAIVMIPSFVCPRSIKDMGTIVSIDIPIGTQSRLQTNMVFAQSDVHIQYQELYFKQP